MLSTVFCIPVSADSVDTSTYKVNVYAYEAEEGGLGQVNINQGQANSMTASKAFNLASKTYNFRTRFTFADTTGSALLTAGKSYKFTADNLSTALVPPTSSGYGVGTVELFDYWLVPADGSDYIKEGNLNIVHNPATGGFSFQFEVTPSIDVYKIVILCNQTYTPSSTVVGSVREISMTFGTIQDGLFVVNTEVQSEEAGLLAGLIEWIKSLIQWVKDIFGILEDMAGNIASGFANIGTWFAELPGKLWSAIETGLQNLFVPDDQYMSEYSDKWDYLLFQRFGALYNVAEMVTDSWDAIIESDLTNTIEMPNVTINLAGSDFSFGGYDVKIVPDGFEGLAYTVKFGLGIVCTYLFINGLLKRYNGVMGEK